MDAFGEAVRVTLAEDPWWNGIVGRHGIYRATLYADFQADAFEAACEFAGGVFRVKLVEMIAATLLIFGAVWKTLRFSSMRVLSGMRRLVRSRLSSAAKPKRIFHSYENQTPEDGC